MLIRTTNAMLPNANEWTPQRIHETACRDGIGDLDSRTATFIITRLFFRDKKEGALNQIHEELYDLVHDVREMVATADPDILRSSLPDILSDLDYLATAFEPGRRPRDARIISAEALTVLTARLPVCLTPPSWAGSHFGDYGRFLIGASAEPHSSVPIEAPPERRPTLGRAGDMIPISGASLLFSGLLNMMSAEDRPFAVSSPELTNWPEGLAQLGFTPDALPKAGIDIRTLKSLEPAQKAEIAELARSAASWLKTNFGITKRNDPIILDRNRLVGPKATAWVFQRLSEVPFPVPTTPERNEVAAFLRDCTDESYDFHPTLRGSLYAVLFDLIRRTAEEAFKCAPETFRRSAQAVGLLDPEKNSAAFDRYAEGFARIFTQIRFIDQARRYIETRRPSIEKMFEPKGEDQYSDEEFSELGRWSDYLKGLLQLGIYEQGHDAAARFDLPAPRWKFPSKLPQSRQEKDLADALVAAAQKGKRA